MLRKIVCLAAVSLTLASCSSSPSPFALMTAAPDRTAEAKTARMSLETTVNGLPGAAGITTTAEGVVDFENQRGSLSFELPAAAGAAGDIELVYAGTVVYLRSPMAIPGVGTEWTSFDVARLGEQVSGTDIEQLSQASSNDPSNSLSLLRGTADSVEEVGTEEVRGEPTTHYRATIDLRRAAEEAGAVRDPRQFEQFLDSFGSDTLPVEVWLDEEGRTRRMRIDQPLPDSPAASVPDDANVVLTMELFDFGVDAPVVIPPASEVTDLTGEVSEAVDELNTTTTTG